jgi:hypothetical protein
MMIDNVFGLLLGVLLVVLFFVFLKLFLLVKDVMTAITLELRFIHNLWSNFIEFFKKNDDK